jgi:hypothetical protein
MSDIRKSKKVKVPPNRYNLRNRLNKKKNEYDKSTCKTIKRSEPLLQPYKNIDSSDSESSSDADDEGCDLLLRFFGIDDLSNDTELVNTQMDVNIPKNIRNRFIKSAQDALSDFVSLCVDRSFHGFTPLKIIGLVLYLMYNLFFILMIYSATVSLRCVLSPIELVSYCIRVLHVYTTYERDPELIPHYSSVKYSLGYCGILLIVMSCLFIYIHFDKSLLYESYKLF